jgi:peptidoglycan-associated lipoprotein
MTMIGRSRCHSRSRSQLLSLTLLVVILAGSTACSTMGPRKHWWEFWKPKASTESVYHPDKEILPPPPNVLDQNGAGLSGSLPAPGALSDATALRKGDLRVASELQTVYFEFDSCELSSSAKSTLDGDAQWLQAHAGNEISIEGHCDERGSEEYNASLGQRRANVVRDYLGSKGIDANKLHTISYGAMRPVDPGHNEASYAKNRRVQFLIY